MKGVVLYVAIVAVWGAVLVPMWLRRDVDNTRSGFWLLGRKTPSDGESPAETHAAALPPSDDDPVPVEVGADADPDADADLDAEADPDVEADADVLSADPPVTRRRRTRSRGAVMARRRRRTLGLGCLVIAAVVAVSMGIGRWWLTLPPVALLVGHLALLRAAARVDVERRERVRAMRAARIHAEREAAERARARAASGVHDDDLGSVDSAEVIDLTEQRSTREVYDQYVDGLRAVGD